MITGPRLGSDHNPLMVDTRGNVPGQQFYFRFSAHWLPQEGFREWVRDKWPSRFKYDPLDHWHVISSKLRRAIKGWGQNLDSQRRKQKEEIIRRIAILDDWSEERELAHLEWEERYALDHTFNQMLLEEELQWQRRGGEK